MPPERQRSKNWADEILAEDNANEPLGEIADNQALQGFQQCPENKRDEPAKRAIHFVHGSIRQTKGQPISKAGEIHYTQVPQRTEGLVCVDDNDRRYKLKPYVSGKKGYDDRLRQKPLGLISDLPKIEDEESHPGLGHDFRNNLKSATFSRAHWPLGNNTELPKAA